MSGHTPGPWEQSHRKGCDGVYEVFRTQVYPASDPDNTIATLHWHSVKTDEGFATDREANARLIAAAPDLLAALEDALDAWETHNKTGDGMQGHWESDARAAIAKAKGGAA